MDVRGITKGAFFAADVVFFVTSGMTFMSAEFHLPDSRRRWGML
jgi:hypothetical protein